MINRVSRSCRNAVFVTMGNYLLLVGGLLKHVLLVFLEKKMFMIRAGLYNVIVFNII